VFCSLPPLECNGNVSLAYCNTLHQEAYLYIFSWASLIPFNTLLRSGSIRTATGAQWSQFLTPNPEVLGSIPGVTKFSA
jgi:hypothetical protein